MKCNFRALCLAYLLPNADKLAPLEDENNVTALRTLYHSYNDLNMEQREITECVLRFDRGK